MRARRKFQISKTTDFDLDLAPLLAVMVKLVPVLLLSSAFVQITMIETDLPQAVKEAIQQNDQKPSASIQIQANLKKGITIVVQKAGQQTFKEIPLLDGSFDYKTLHSTLQKVKIENPEVFRAELNPDASVPYSDIVKIMDEARRSRDKEVRFPIFDKNENKTVQTDFMFPDIVFSNVMDG